MQQRRSGHGRAARLAIAVLGGLILGAGLYVAVPLLTAPGPRDAPGWQLLAEMPDPRGETAVAELEGRVYVIGGFVGLGFETTGLVSIYDAAADRWAAGPPLPEPRNHAAAAVLDGLVYVSGGAGPDGAPSPAMWALAPGDAWEPRAAMPGPRSGHRLVAADGQLYAIGGVGGPSDGPGRAGAVLIYDPVSDAWFEGAVMELNRDHLGAVLVGGEIWAIGGRAGDVNHVRVDIYDPAADAWREGPPLPEGTSGAAEANVDGVLYLSGGEDPGRGLIVDRHWRLDTTLGEGATWEALPPPPLAVHGVPGAAMDGRFLVIAGSTRPGGQSSTAWTGATQAFEP